MDVLKPLQVLVAVLVRLVVSSTVAQLAGLACLSYAAGLVWGAAGALAAAGVSLVLVGVAVERGD